MTEKPKTADAPPPKTADAEVYTIESRDKPTIRVKVPMTPRPSASWRLQ